MTPQTLKSKTYFKSKSGKNSEPRLCRFYDVAHDTWNVSSVQFQYFLEKELIVIKTVCEWWCVRKFWLFCATLDPSFAKKRFSHAPLKIFLANTFGHLSLFESHSIQ